MKNVAVFQRVSNKKLKKDLAFQKKLLKDYCKKNNLNIVENYTEIGSASDTIKRPGFSRFIESFLKNKNEVEMLLFTSWDRISRNVTKALDYSRLLHGSGITLHAINQPIEAKEKEFLAEAEVKRITKNFVKYIPKK